MIHKKRECPECGSENVKPDTTGKTIFSHGDINSWTCNECGHSGIFPEKAEDDENQSSNQSKNIKEKYSKNYLILLFAIIFALLLLATIYLN